MTFEEFWPEYIRQKNIVVKKTTVCAYTLIWETHVCKFLGKQQIEETKNSTLQKYVNAQLECGRHLKSIQDEVMVAKNMIKMYCVANDIPLINPIIVYPTKGKVVGKKIREKFGDEDLKKIVEYCRKSERHHDKAIALAALTGMRIGEVCGLRFSDFDFKQKTVKISRTVGRLYMGKGETLMYVNTPKTPCSERIVPVPDWLIMYYKNYQKLYGYKDDDFVTRGDEKTEFIEPRTMRQKFKRVCYKIGVEYKPPHSLRHSYASRLLLNGVDVRTAAELLGHSDVAMTLNVYSHSDESAKRKAALKTFM